MITSLRKPPVPPADFRTDVLGRLKEVNPKWMNVTPLIYERMKKDGKRLKYYTRILEALAQKKHIELDLDELYKFEWYYRGEFDDFPLQAMITPEGIEEYFRLRKNQTDSLQTEYQLRRIRRADLFAWIFLVACIISTFLALAKTFHLLGL